MLRRFLNRFFGPSRPAQRRLTADQLAWYVQADGRACRPVLFTGDSVQACESLLEATLPALSGCVLHLQGSKQPLLNFEDAPLMGTFTPQNGSPEPECLDAVLETRMPGYFYLDMPAQLNTEENIEDMLSKTLLAGALHMQARMRHSALPPLTIVLDNWRTWLPEALLIRVLAQAHTFQFQVMLTDDVVHASDYADKIAHLIALPTHSKAICGQFGEAGTSLSAGCAMYARRSDCGTPPTLWEVAA